MNILPMYLGLALAFGPAPDARASNLLYACGDITNTIYAFDARQKNGAPVSQITTGLSIPFNLAVDNHGDVFASNLGTGTVTGYKPGASSPFVTYSNILSPAGVVVGDDGSMFVSNFVGAGTETASVEVFPPNASAPTVVLTNPAFHQVNALTLDPKGNLYIAYTSGSGSTNNVQAGLMVLPAGGKKLKKTGILLPDFQAQSVIIDQAGNIIFSVSNTGNGTAAIDIFPPGAKAPSKVIGPPTLLNYPQQISLNANETRIFVGGAGPAVNVYNYKTWKLVNSFSISAQTNLQGVAASPKAPF